MPGLIDLHTHLSCTEQGIDRAIDASVDTIEHSLPRTDEATARVASAGIASDPALVPYEIIFDLNGGYWGSTSRRFTFSKAANVEMLRWLGRAGVTLGIGTDCVANWFRYMPGPYRLEMQRSDAACIRAPPRSMFRRSAAHACAPPPFLRRTPS